MGRLRIFFIDNKTLIIITFVGIVLIALSIYGFSKMDSFFRDRCMAEIPIYIIVGCIHAAIFVYMHLLVYSGFRFSRNKIKANNVKVFFKDVIGLEGAKREALEVVQLVKDRKQLRKVGGKIIKGILLMGPPGCGKTLLARAVATECDIPFISAVGSEFNEIFVGVGASRVRSLFKRARSYASAHGACVIFIDEVDVIGTSRSFRHGFGETNATQNQLLAQMDGISSGKDNVIVIAATNADEDVLDKALIRPGRFDRKITIALPNLREREQLFDFYLKKVKVAPEVDKVRLAKKTVWKSPAEIENIVKEASLIAIRKKKEVVDMKDLSEAMDRIDLGMETNLDMTPRELEMTAYHEAGHAVTIYLMHPNDDVFKVSVKSHAGTLGLVYHVDREQVYSPNKEHLLADIMVSIAAYIAEKIKYNTTTSGVSQDFTTLMSKANNMVWKLGMGNNFVGNFSAIPSEQMSQSLKEKLNNETISIVNSCYTKVEEFLKKNWDAVDAVAKKLVEVKELDFDEFEEVMNSVGKKKKI
ncbi:MAG: AAA family ATPase [Endomicrobium sp.]|jgi:cell division protease FtsH|nr:AAA family ATPase [Endomicrobium sp.]